LPKNHDCTNLKQAIHEAMDDPFSLGIVYKRIE
jgi:hypothetical protein